MPSVPKERSFGDMDIFADPVQLRFNGRTHYQTPCGGLISVCYFVQIAFVLAMMGKSLITGYYISPSTTTYDMIMTDDGFQNGSTLTDLDIKFGFKNTASALTYKKSEWQSLAPAIGRLEVLYITRDGDTIKQKRLKIETCSTNTNAWCIIDNNIDLWGDPYQGKFGIAILQVRPCQTHDEIKDLMTPQQISSWQSNRAKDSSETPETSLTCQNAQTIKDFFSKNRLVIESQNNYFKADFKDEPNPEYLPTYTATVQDKIVGMSYKETVDGIRLKENQIFWTSFWTKLWGIQRIELYTELEDAISYSLYDEDLTRGYIQSTTFMKSNKYTSTNMSQYVMFDLIGHLAATMLGIWWFYKFVHELLPMRLNSDIDVASQIYRVSESNDNTNVMQLKNAMQEMADRIQSETPDARTLGEKLKLAIRMKLYERLQTEIDSMQSVKNFQGNYNKLALDNLLNGDQKSAKHSLLMYLSANLFHKPKFTDLSFFQTLQVHWCKSTANKKQAKNVAVAKQKLDKDLDICTYLRTVNKVRGVVQCTLDDKQRMMLKYNSHRMISAYKNQFKNVEDFHHKDSVIGTANVIFEKFSEQGSARRNEYDLRYLLGLGHIWGNLIPESFKVQQQPVPVRRPAPQQRPIPDQNNRYERARQPQNGIDNYGFDGSGPQPQSQQKEDREQNTQNISNNTMLPLDSSDINKTIEDFQHELDNSQSNSMEQPYTPVAVSRRNLQQSMNMNEDTQNQNKSHSENQHQTNQTIANNMSTSMMFINDEPTASDNGANNSAFAMRPKRRKTHAENKNQ